MCIRDSLRKECPGFIANRLQLALYREVQDLVMRGVCSVEDVDKALVYGPGIRWAIFGHNMIMQMGNPGGLTGMVIVSYTHLCGRDRVYAGGDGPAGPLQKAVSAGDPG